MCLSVVCVCLCGLLSEKGGGEQMCCNVLQYVLQCVAVLVAVTASVFQCDAEFCNVTQCVEACGRVLQCVLQCVSVCCSVLQ